MNQFRHASEVQRTRQRARYKRRLRRAETSLDALLDYLERALDGTITEREHSRARQLLEHVGPAVELYD